MQAQHAVMQQSLHYAEEAAATANSECATLAAAVQAMTEQDARARCGLAHRAHHLRDALLQTSAALRQFNDRDRKERNEVGAAGACLHSKGYAATWLYCCARRTHLA